jgi:SpoVK/Ycf46/Vps4 family AAA+-type ATPase
MTVQSEEQQTLKTVDFPDPDARRRAESLVGVDHVTTALLKDLIVTLRPDELAQWARRFGRATAIVKLVHQRPHMYIIAGDVGTGKTEISETIGDTVARELDIPVTLFKMGLGTRGTGLVGEMSRLISASFDEVAATALTWKGARGARSAGILFIDEADALAQSRELSQMHHEDRAGVNALIRGVDDLTREELPVAVLMATNRLSSLDPAIRRRAARTFELTRPSAALRYAILHRYLADFTRNEIDFDNLVRRTGELPERPYGFTYSDLTQRLLPDAVMEAFPREHFTIKHVEKVLDRMEPTPPFRSA